MLVPAMTLEEVHHEIMADLAYVMRKVHVLGDIFQVTLKRKKLRCETRLETFTTPRRNEWNIMFRVFPDRIMALSYLRAHDRRGAVTYQVEFFEDSGEKYIIKLNTHFFKRYNERLGLGITRPADVIKHFVKHNFDVDYVHSDMLANGRRLVHFAYSNGIGAGWEDEAQKVIHVKTFIPHHMLNKTQQGLLDYIMHNDGEEFYTTMNTKRFWDTED